MHGLWQNVKQKFDDTRRSQAVIGQLREGPLTATSNGCSPARRRVRGQGRRYVIDLVRADGELVEVQTGSFSPLRAKLDALLDRHRMRIVHPIPAQRRILRVDEHGEVLSTRPSPKKPGPPRSSRASSLPRY